MRNILLCALSALGAVNAGKIHPEGAPGKEFCIKHLETGLYANVVHSPEHGGNIVKLVKPEDATDPWIFTP